MNAIAVTVETHERGSMFAEFWSVVRISEDRPKPATTNSAPVPPRRPGLTPVSVPVGYQTSGGEGGGVWAEPVGPLGGAAAEKRAESQPRHASKRKPLRHAQTLWQCDFLSKPMWTTKGLVDLYCLVFIHLGTRRVWLSPLHSPAELSLDLPTGPELPAACRGNQSAAEIRDARQRREVFRSV